MKKLFMFIAIAALLPFGAYNVGATAEDDEPDFVTASEIEESMKAEIQKASSEEKVELEQDLEEFQSLTEEEEDKFLSYLNDEEVIRTIFESHNEGTTTIKNGGITLTTEQKSTGATDLPGRTNIFHSSEVEVFDIRVLVVDHILTINYDEDEEGDRSITGVNGNHVEDLNFIPFVGTEIEEEEEFILEDENIAGYESRLQVYFRSDDNTITSGKLYIHSDPYLPPTGYFNAGFDSNQ